MGACLAVIYGPVLYQCGKHLLYQHPGVLREASGGLLPGMPENVPAALVVVGSLIASGITMDRERDRWTELWEKLTD